MGPSKKLSPEKVSDYIKSERMFFLWSLAGFFPKTSKFNVIEDIVHNLALATLALKDGDTVKSEKTLLKTLNVAEISNFSLGIISACDILSTLSIKAGDYNKAEKYLIRALDNLFRLGAPEDDNYVVSFNLKLSRVYHSSGNDEKAELSYKNCMQLQKKKLKKPVNEEAFLLWMTILYWYGKFLFGKYRFEEAKMCLHDCYLTSAKVTKMLPSQLMVILYNLSEICLVLGDYDEATEHLLNGVSIDKQCQNPDLAYFYIKLGKLSLWRELYNDAKFWCAQGKKVAQKYRNIDAENQSNECLEKIQRALLGKV